jgi:hypothetical protein
VVHWKREFLNVELRRPIGNRASALPGKGVKSGMTWPITSKSGTFTYSLGADFAQKHVADDLGSAGAKARALYDPWHQDQHRAAVTVIVQNTLMQVTEAEELTPTSGYDWSLRIEGVTAVMMGPSGRGGANGDPGQLDDHVDSVIVSGYNTGPGTGRITHIAASQ